MANCNIDGCARVHHAKGYCVHHYQRSLRYGTPTGLPPEKVTQCSVSGCTKEGKIVRGLCTIHYYRNYTYGDPTAETKHRTATRSGTLEGRFRQGVPDTVGPDDCWEWTRFRDKAGYGRIKYLGKIYGAHRVSYTVHYGVAIPHGLVVRHSCDNPPCVNPSHLVLGTDQDNVDDMNRRGRQAIQRGERNGRAKVTEGDVREIRSLYSAGASRKEISDKFGISGPTVYNIVHKRTWKHITD